eukprot:CAMPEP_0113943430 /NCGR_PEP_ID=MMETSP1339-20121228/23650_1 /TAXON_ID=94617 /ORGANISM="Fibrocapsa japonica" /LENGTH=210 /DNA_ID=CAMNT_0000948293 /DNA_START=59 /DNA_END=691 /DNA_ORIENTATION=+ /assembly_acc=CAM_ASM_000762
MAILNPRRADMVACLGEVTGRVALQRLRDRMRADENGLRILKERPLLGKHDPPHTIGLDLHRLRGLPKGTFGRCYSDFMDHHGFSPESRDQVRFVDDEELAYIMLRYRQVHDFWHVLVDLEPDVAGEVALKWFEMVQTGLPVAALSALVGPLQLSAEERSRLRIEYLPWALKAGRTAVPLINVVYEDYFDKEIEDMRENLKIIKAPQLGS